MHNYTSSPSSPNSTTNSLWSYLGELNESQKSAISNNEGPLMILAGAGSGKTRTLVAKVIYLITQAKIAPWQILVLTFSNKAAKEAKERVHKFSESNFSSLPLVTTFHSFCAYVLRHESEYLGLGKNFTIYDEQESKSVMTSVLGKNRLSLKEIPVNAVLSYVDDLKNNGYYSRRYDNLKGKFKEHEEYFSTSKNMLKPLIEHEYFPLFIEYENELASSNAIDFGGLLTNALRLFESFPEVLTKYQQKYRYILIDEYQDTNKAQFELLLHLSMLHKNICVVGDEDQSIYSWRGACIQNITDFHKYFPNFSIIKLEQNYRSTQMIINAAAKVVENNTLRYDKKIWTDNPAGDHVQIVECSNDQSEGEFVSSEIKSLLDRGTCLRDVAVFYRNNSQSRMIEEYLLKKNIPYKIIGGIRFYERKEIKDLLSYLRIVINPMDSLALIRAINTPLRGIGAVSLKKFEDEANTRNSSLWHILEHYLAHGDSQFSQKITLSSKGKDSLGKFIILIKSLQTMSSEGILPSVCYKKILSDSGIIDSLKAEKNHESLARIENLQELLSAIQQYENLQTSLEQIPSLAHFLETITLDATNDNTHSNQDSARGEISLMTIHGAKGLEYPFVFVVGVEENLFPSYKSLESPRPEIALEEERRLFYVAMTRAMKRLYITYAKSRLLYGTVRFNDPGRFIYEVPAPYCVRRTFQSDRWNFGSEHSPSNRPNSTRKISTIIGNKQSPIKAASSLLSSSPSSSASVTITATTKEFKKGQYVTHAVYGVGTIFNVEGHGENAKVWIQFSSGIKKQFSTKVAPLTIH
ncbi:MAG: UvrD-helicase domain-containing protein [Oligoflexia bacterium]|nr:UvrD-helicase domain-containing protein [Oligoflexia bacterium]MBF0364778.1 UvrD-helicase domain-containing protein [Oligoflexia bacterium]